MGERIFKGKNEHISKYWIRSAVFAVNLPTRTNQSLDHQKRSREESTEADEADPVAVLKAVGELGKGFVRNIYLLKAPRVTS